MQSLHIEPSSGSTIVQTPFDRHRRASPSRRAQLTTSIAKLRKDIDDTRSRLNEVCAELQLRTNGGPDSDKHGQRDDSPDASDTHDHSSQDLIIKEARQVVDRHIKTLMKYNKLKDTAMALLEVISENEGKTVTQVMNERDVLDD